MMKYLRNFDFRILGIFGDFLVFFGGFLEIFMDLSDEVVTPLDDKYFNYSINYEL